jgi:glyoxylate reductase
MKVYVTRVIPDIAERMLTSAGHTVIVSSKDDVLTHEELISEVAKHKPDALLCLLNDTIDRAVFDACPQLKIIANYAVGYNNISLDIARERQIIVTNTPDVLTDAVAEHTIALMLSITRRVVESDAYTRAGKYTGWGPLLLLGTELKGKTLGLLGAGRIGVRVAEIARTGFGMQVCYYDIQQNSLLEKNTGATFCATPDALLQQADIVSIHVPLLPATTHLLNAARLRMMKKSAYLINTARGPIVDEVALVEALKEGVIRGAALDVFEYEPKLAEGLAQLSNVVLTPHTASASDTARTAMAEVAAQNIIAVLAGKSALHRVQ